MVSDKNEMGQKEMRTHRTVTEGHTDDHKNIKNTLRES